MHDFNIRDLTSDRISFNDITAMGTVIVSHAVDPMSELAYYRYLAGLGPRVVLVASKDSALLHMVNEAHELGVETYTDPDHHLISQLKQRWNLTPDNNILARLLRFQILYHDGREIGAWHQPVVDQWSHFLEDRRAVKSFINRFGVFGVEWMKSQDKDTHVMWSGQNQFAFARPINSPGGEYDLFLKHYRLMPNREMEDILQRVAS
jgi:hypothetical protein